MFDPIYRRSPVNRSARKGHGYRPLLEALEERLNPAPGVIPQHAPDLRVAQIAYDGAVFTPYEDDLLRNSVDLVIREHPTLAHVAAVAPNTPELLYINTSNIYVDKLTDWLNYADAHGLPRESAFLHVSTLTAFSGTSPSSQPVNWFWGVYRGSSTLTNLTAASRGSSGTFDFGGPGDSVDIAYPDRFREINLVIAQRAQNPQSYQLEYPSAVDANGQPTQWTPLPLLADGTAGLTSSGRILFDPPANWQTAVLPGSGNSARLYYVRFHNVQPGQAPVLSSILGRDYVGANGGNAGVIPVFDSAADTNHDGYLDDAEYAHRAPGEDARFAYESRLFYGSPGFSYGQMRFSTNPSDPGYVAWAVDYSTRLLNDNPLAAGLFMDNSGGLLPVADPTGVVEQVSSYAADYGAMLGAIDRAIAPRWIMANVPRDGNTADAVIQNTQAYFEEPALRPLMDIWQSFESAAAQVARRAALTPTAPYAVLSSDSSDPSGNVALTDPRSLLATLAYYYLLADPNTTFLNINGSAPNEGNTAWSRHWLAAANYDIGTPSGSWSLVASGADPQNTSLTYRVYGRDYTNALVLYKPLSANLSDAPGTDADATATTLTLGGSYYVLNADGTLAHNADGSLKVVTSITLRNGEGAILVKRPGAADGFTQDGALSAAWTFRLGAFTAQGGVAAGGTGPTPGQVNLATVTGLSLQDAVIQADVTVAPSKTGALLARYGGPGDNNFYAAVLARDGAGNWTAWIFKSDSNGAQSDLTARVPVGTASAGTLHLQLEAVGSSLTLSVNGEVVVSAVDSTYAGPGGFGIRGRDGTAFDNFAVTALTPPAAAVGDTFRQPDNFPLSRYTWVDTAGGFATVGGQAVAQGPAGPSVATLYGVSQRDVAVEADVTVSAPGDAAGVVARYTGAGSGASYYAGVLMLEPAGASPSAYYAQIWKVVNGQITVLPGSSVFVGTANDPPTGHLRFEVSGSTLQLYVDSVLRSRATDTGITGPGTVGLRGGEVGDAFANFTFSTSAALFSDAFASAALGTSWTLQGGGFTTQGGRVTASGVDVNSGAGTAVATALGSLSDVIVEADVTVTNPGDSVTLLARYSGTNDANNSFYSASIFLNTDGRYYAMIWKKVNGSWAWPQAVQAPLTLFPGGGPFHLRFEVLGNTLSLYVDGALAVSTTDPNAVRLTAGLVGIRGKLNTTFANFEVHAFSTGFSDSFAQSSGPLSASWADDDGGGFVVRSAQAVGAVAPTGQADVATVSGAQLTDAAVVVDVTLAAQGDLAGAVARYQPTGTYYAGVLYRDTANHYFAQIYLYTPGTPTQLASVQVAALAGPSPGNARLCFEVLGGSLALYVNGILEAQATDGTIVGPGGVGMTSAAGDVLDNFTTLAIGSAFNPIAARSTPLAADTFAAPSGSALDPSRWAQQTLSGPGFTIQGGQATVPTGLAIATVSRLSLKDAAIEADVTVGPGNTAVLLARYVGPGDANYYAGVVARDAAGNYTAWIFKHDANGAQIDLTTHVPIAVGTSATVHLWLEAVGTTLTFFVNGVVVGSAVDASFTSGGFGIRGRTTAAFDNVEVFALPPLFGDTFAQGAALSASWNVQGGSFAVSGGRALGTAPAGQVSLAAVGGAAAADVAVSADVTLAHAGDSAGVVARYQDPQNYLTAVLFSDGVNTYARIYRYSGGTPTLLATSGPLGNLTGPHRLRLEVIGTSLAVYVDGAFRAQAVDGTITAAGGFGILGGRDDALGNFTAVLL